MQRTKTNKIYIETTSFMVIYVPKKSEHVKLATKEKTPWFRMIIPRTCRHDPGHVTGIFALPELLGLTLCWKERASRSAWFHRVSDLLDTRQVLSMSETCSDSRTQRCSQLSSKQPAKSFWRVGFGFKIVQSTAEFWNGLAKRTKKHLDEHGEDVTRIPTICLSPCTSQDPWGVQTAGLAAAPMALMAQGAGCWWLWDFMSQTVTFLRIVNRSTWLRLWPCYQHMFTGDI